MRRLLFLVLMLSCTLSVASPYQWQFSRPNFFSWCGPQPTFGSTKTAAIDDFTTTCVGTDGAKFVFVSVVLDTPTEYRVQYDWIRGDGSNGGRHTLVSRLVGDHCENPDHVLNPETGACDSTDACQDRAGQQVSLSKSGKGPDAFMYITPDGSNYAVYGSACHDSCQVSTAGHRCLVRVSGDYSCKIDGIYTGDMCVQTPGQGNNDNIDPVVDGADDLELPPPEKTEDYIPCAYEVRPDGSRGCISQNIIEEEGLSCGISNGQMVCSPSTPKKDDLKIETTITETTKPDGSTETTKTDTADYVTCVGAKCTTSTTTSTTTTSKDGNGNTTSVSGSCTGPLCADKHGDPNGQGDGLGSCIGPNCSEGGGDGDGFEGGELGEVKEFGESVEDFMERVGEAPIMQALQGLAFPSGGSCGFGAASTPIGNISLDGMCTNSHWLDPLYPIFLAVWCFAAIRVFMEA